MIGNIAARVLMRRTMTSGTPVFHRLLAGVAAVLAFAFVAALLAGALIIGISYFAYHLLVERGIDADVAMMSVGGFLFLLICVFVTAAVLCAKKVRHLPRQVVAAESPLAHRINSVANAFVDGLMTTTVRR